MKTSNTQELIYSNSDEGEQESNCDNAEVVQDTFASIHVHASVLWLLSFKISSPNTQESVLTQSNWAGTP